MTGPTMTLVCPKCAGQMRSYERNGITVDQCTECRGIFLDRGELERLIEAEGTRAGPTRLQDDDPSRGGSEEGGQRKRRGGFLGDLLDFD